jgi:hypothetical protein
MAEAAAPAFDELPYLEEYLRQVLRPRVERVLHAAERSITESIWRQVVKVLAAEQPSPTEATGPAIRHLLEERLGLKIQASLSHTFAAEEPAAAEKPRETPMLEIVTPVKRNGDSDAPVVGRPAAARR